MQRCRCRVRITAVKCASQVLLAGKENVYCLGPPLGALTSRLDSDAQSLFELMSFNITLTMLSVITVLVCSVLSMIVSWKLGLVGVFAGIPPMTLGAYICIRVETKMDAAHIDAKFSKSASIASERVTAIRIAPSLVIEIDVTQRYTAELDTTISDARLSLVIMVFLAFTQSVEFFVVALGF
ncbi:ABC multidrug transporter atrC like protein [Verticillium longisporum]|nr:ABC multidrug transporter atrC like protein [Verticillium longisporum]